MLLCHLEAILGVLERSWNDSGLFSAISGAFWGQLGAWPVRGPFEAGSPKPYADATLPGSAQKRPGIQGSDPFRKYNPGSWL